MAATVRLADAQPPAGHLGAARPVPGLQALNAGGSAEVSIVRCPSPGFCTAAGSYSDGIGNNGLGRHQAFVATETDFTWGNAIPVPGLAALNNGGPTNITAMSCPEAGSCTVGGWYVDTGGNLQPFAAESVNGTFGNAHAMFTVDNQIHQFMARFTALSCATPRNCTAALILPSVPAGGGAPVPEAFLVTETSGNWGPLRAVPGIPGSGARLPSGISSVSCWKPGDCMAVGGSTAVGRNGNQPLLAVQEGGNWSAENTIPGIDGRPVIDFNPAADAEGTQVSCWAFTSCTVAGVYGDRHGGQQVFVADWVNGSWATQTLPGSTELNRGGSAALFGLACGPAGNCATGGSFPTAPLDDPSVQFHALVDSRVAGDWGNAQEIDGISNLSDSEVSATTCPATGSCVAGGHYTDPAGHQQAYVSYENTTAGTRDVGSFRGAQQIAGNLNAGGSAGVGDLSCSFAGECGIGGFYTDANNKQQGFVADQSAATATTLSATATTVAAGNEQDVHITATVTPFAGGTPTGTVTVLANGAQSQTTVCTITLSGGSGDCALPAGSLTPGSYSFFGNYNGDQVYGGSTSTSGGSGGLTMHVVPAKLATTTSLAVSPAKVAFGREQAARLTVTVTSKPGDTPAGKVTIKAGSVTVGVITLVKGKGAKTLAAGQLRPGSYHLTAAYGGDPGSKASASGSKALTITREPTSTTLKLSAAEVKAGHEQAEHLTVQVRPATSGTPAGKVTIKAGPATLCVITLKGAKGSCTLTASKLRPGTYHLTASYGGGTPYAASTSPKKTLTVTK